VPQTASMHATTILRPSKCSLWCMSRPALRTAHATTEAVVAHPPLPGRLRSPKAEGRNSKETRTPKGEADMIPSLTIAATGVVDGPSGFGLRTSFSFRLLDFGFRISAWPSDSCRGSPCSPAPILCRAFPARLRPGIW
jgi:hypothetical protein